MKNQAACISKVTNLLMAKEQKSKVIVTREQERIKTSLVRNKKGCSSSTKKKIKNAKFGEKH